MVRPPASEGLSHTGPAAPSVRPAKPQKPPPRGRPSAATGGPALRDGKVSTVVYDCEEVDQRAGDVLALAAA